MISWRKNFFEIASFSWAACFDDVLWCLLLQNMPDPNVCIGCMRAIFAENTSFHPSTVSMYIVHSRGDRWDWWPLNMTGTSFASLCWLQLKSRGFWSVPSHVMLKCGYIPAINGLRWLLLWVATDSRVPWEIRKQIRILWISAGLNIMKQKWYQSYWKVTSPISLPKSVQCACSLHMEESWCSLQILLMHPIYIFGSGISCNRGHQQCSSTERRDFEEILSSTL